MSIICESCDEATAISSNDWYTYCRSSACNGKTVLIAPTPAGKKYIRFETKVSGGCSMVDANSVIYQDLDGLCHVIGDEVYKVKNQQAIYATVRVSGVVKERLIQMKNCLESAKEEVEKMTKKWEEAEASLSKKEEEMLAKEKDFEAAWRVSDVFRRMMNKEDVEKETKWEQEREEKLDDIRMQWERAEDKIKGLEEDKIGMAKEIFEFQERLSSAKDELEDLNAIASFRKDQSNRAEESLEKMRSAFQEYKKKSEEDMAEMSRNQMEEITVLGKMNCKLEVENHSFRHVICQMTQQMMNSSSTTLPSDLPATSITAAGGVASHKPTNGCTDRLAFDVRSCDDECRIKHVFGFVDPSATADLEVTPTAGVPKEDKLVVENSVVPADATEAFKGAPPAGAREKRLGMCGKMEVPGSSQMEGEDDSEA